jgi:hypothetical protein
MCYYSAQAHAKEKATKGDDIVVAPIGVHAIGFKFQDREHVVAACLIPRAELVFKKDARVQMFRGPLGALLAWCGIRRNAGRIATFVQVPELGYIEPRDGLYFPSIAKTDADLVPISWLRVGTKARVQQTAGPKSATFEREEVQRLQAATPPRRRHRAF